MLPIRILFLQIFFLLFLYAGGLEAAPLPSIAQPDTLSAAGKTTPVSIRQSIETFVAKSIFRTFGIHTSVVLRDEYDTGFGFGARITRGIEQTVIPPDMELTTTVSFWGATSDTVDVTAAGIECMLAFAKSPRPGVKFFTGVSGGYFATDTTTEGIIDGFPRRVEVGSNTFDTYLVTGFRFTYRPRREIYIQCNYALTKPYSETHILIGLQFTK